MLEYTLDQSIFNYMMVCHNDNAAVCPPQLLLGWVTVCEQINHLSVEPATQVDSAFSSLWVSKVSISFCAE